MLVRRRLRATLYRRGRPIWRAPVGIGKHYSVLSDWPGGGIVGIHGTSQPLLIPGRPSHGCIRVRNQAVRELWRLLPIGTPLLIR